MIHVRDSLSHPKTITKFIKEPEQQRTLKYILSRFLLQLTIKTVQQNVLIFINDFHILDMLGGLNLMKTFSGHVST